MLKMIRVSAHMVAALAIIITGVFVFMMFIGKRLRFRTERI
jgi:flagellar biogenesis protein FliO